MTPSLFRAEVGRLGRCAVPVIFLFSVLAFVADLWRADTLAFGLFYTPLVSSALLLRPRRAVWLLSGLATAFVAIGAFFPIIDPDLPDLIGNRVLSVIAILATALFVQQARRMQERLAEQTRRAEAAERIASEVLTKLGTEIRGPLEHLLGVSQLLMLDARPHQREALIPIRAGVRQLLASTRNLIDLTSLQKAPFEPVPLDVRPLARAAVGQARALAAERQVALRGPDGDIPEGDAPEGNIPEGDIPEGDIPERRAPCLVLAEAWALRRILDTLLHSAIAHVPAGGVVSLRLQRREGAVALSVSDPCGTFARHLHEDPLSSCAGGGTALSARLAERLAERLGCRLQPAEGPDGEAAIEMRLRPAGRA